MVSWLSPDERYATAELPKRYQLKEPAVTITIPFRPAHLMHGLLHPEQHERVPHDSHDHGRHESEATASRRAYYESGLMSRELRHL